MTKKKKEIVPWLRGLEESDYFILVSTFDVKITNPAFYFVWIVAFSKKQKKVFLDVVNFFSNFCETISQKMLHIIHIEYWLNSD